MQIKVKKLNNNKVKLGYKWSHGIYKSPLYYNTEFLLETDTFEDNLISFDPKYGMNECLEFNFIPIFIAHQNPPAQVHFYT